MQNYQLESEVKYRADWEKSIKGRRCALDTSEVEADVGDLSFRAPFSYASDSTYSLTGLLVRKVALKLQCLNFLAVKVSVLMVVAHYWTHLVHFH
jgi:hypothetical protein